MAALPVSDFARDVGIDFPRESATATVRAKSRPDETRDRAAPDDVREDRVSDFDKALREQEADEPVRAGSARSPERLTERSTETAAKELVRIEDPTAEALAPEDSKGAAKPDSVKTRPEKNQVEPELTAKPAILLPEVVQVVSAAAPKVSAAKPEAIGEAGVDVKAEGADAVAKAPADFALIPAVIAPNTGVQTLTAALNSGTPAPQQAQQHAASATDAGGAAPAADPLALLSGAQTGLKPDAASQAAPQSNSQAPAAQPGAPTPPHAALEAAAAAPSPDAKVRQTSDQSAKTSDAAAQGGAAAPAATAQNTAQPVAVLQSALNAAAAQGSKDAKAPDVQNAEIKLTAASQPSAFAAPLDAQSTQATTHTSSATPGHASSNSTAIAQNVVRFFRETGSGNARFDIRLDPVELGRVDARVEINHDKTVTLTLSAERPETLAELMRTARDLERQLTDSGVKLSEDGLKFRLNSDARGDAQQNMQGGSEGRRPARGAYAAGAESALQAEAAIPIRGWRASGVDVWA